MTNELIGIKAKRSLDREVGDMLDLATQLETLGVRKAVTASGTYYERNQKNGTTVIAARDIQVKKSPSLLTISLTLPDASPESVLAELQPATQTQRGAVLGCSQQQVSVLESK